MKTNLQSTYIPQYNQKRSDNDSVGRGKAQTFHIQTGIRAGGLIGNLFNWFLGVTEGMTDRQRAEVADEML